MILFCFYRKMAKFIVVLIPLFGVCYIVFSFLAGNDIDVDRDIPYLYVEMFYNSFQVCVFKVIISRKSCFKRARWSCPCLGCIDLLKKSSAFGNWSKSGSIFLDITYKYFWQHKKIELVQMLLDTVVNIKKLICFVSKKCLF